MMKNLFVKSKMGNKCFFSKTKIPIETNEPRHFSNNNKNTRQSLKITDTIKKFDLQEHIEKLKTIEKVDQDSDENGTFVICKIVQVLDGDTIRIAFFPKQKMLMGKDSIQDSLQLKVRLDGIDTPEMKPPKKDPNREQIKQRAIESKNFLQKQLEESVIGPNVALLKFGKYDKYGRMLANVYTRIRVSELSDIFKETQFCRMESTFDEKFISKIAFKSSLNQLMIDNGFAVKYDGKTKQKSL